MKKNTQKIWFLQLTRIVACLLVVYTHWFGFLMNPNALNALIAQKPIAHYPHIIFTDYISIITHFFKINHFTSVYFGLGLFFLLSGYVIPLSVKNSTPGDYLIRRIFRIYPTLIACLLIASSIMLFANIYLGSSREVYFFQLKTLLANMLLLRDIVHLYYIENATWTLEIEIHFYVLFFLFFYFAIEKRIMTFIVFAGLLLGLSHLTLYLTQVYPERVIFLLAYKFITLNNNFLPFMFVGTTLYYTLSKQWPYFKGLLTAVTLLWINYLSLNVGSLNAGTGSVMFLNHLYAVCFFLLLYKLNDSIPYSGVLNKIAEISYPLYLLHGFTGYTLYFLFYHLTHNVPLSFAGVFGGVALLVIAVHYGVEQPGISWSKKIINNKRYFFKIPPFLKPGTRIMRS